MIELSPNVDALFPALHKAQATLTGVVKDGKNPAFKSRYATLENVIDAARPPLQAAGLAFTQAPGALVDGAIEITTMLMHTSGQWLRSTLHVPLSKRDPQGVGSAITYGCRYALMATLGLPPVDDDGEAAMDRNSPSAPTPGRNAAGAGNAAPSVKTPAATLSTKARLIAAMAGQQSASSLFHWWNNPKVQEAYASLATVEQAGVDAAKAKRLSEIEDTPFAEAAE